MNRGWRLRTANIPWIRQHKQAITPVEYRERLNALSPSASLAWSDKVSVVRPIDAAGLRGIGI